MDTAPPQLEIQAALIEHGLTAIVNKYNLNWRAHKKYPNLILFKYRDLNAKFHKRLVQECRGIILDSEKNWEVVAWPYLKFFNYSEKLAAPIDWTTARVYEKLDGCLSTLYCYKDEWFVSSSGIPDGSQPLPPYQGTFQELFWSIWKKKNMLLPSEKRYTFVFELLSPCHVIVVRPKEDAIILHGVRDTQTLKELDPEPFAKKYGWTLANIHEYTSLEAVKKAALSLNPVQDEGFVVCDKSFNRVKVKAPQYVALAHLSEFDSGFVKFGSILRILIANEGSEFLVYFPQYARLYEVAKAVYERFNIEIKLHTDLIKSRLQENPTKELLADEKATVEQRLVYLHITPDHQVTFFKVLDIFLFNERSFEEVFMDERSSQGSFLALIQTFLTPQEQLECQKCTKKKPKNKKKKNQAIINTQDIQIEYVQTLVPQKKAPQPQNPGKKKNVQYVEEEEKPPPKKKLTKKQKHEQALADAEFDRLMNEFKDVPQHQPKKGRNKK